MSEQSDSRYARKRSGKVIPQVQFRRPKRTCSACGGTITKHAHVSATGMSIFCSACKK